MARPLLVAPHDPVTARRVDGPWQRIADLRAEDRVLDRTFEHTPTYPSHIHCRARIGQRDDLPEVAAPFGQGRCGELARLVARAGLRSCAFRPAIAEER